MKTFRTILAALLLALFCIAPSYADTPMQQARSVVVLLGTMSTAGGGSCSAVVLKPGLALTAGHCTEIPEMVLKLADGKTLPVTAFTVAPARDLAVLVVPGLTCPCAQLTREPIVQDELVMVVGFPYGMTAQVVTVGRAQARITDPDDSQEYLMTTAPAAPGNSGGGLFVIRAGAAYLVGIMSKSSPNGNLTLSVEVRPAE